MNNCKQDLEVASIEYMLRLMWVIAPFWDAMTLEPHGLNCRDELL